MKNLPKTTCHINSFPWWLFHLSNSPLYPKKDGISWRRRHAANFQHCQHSAGRPMVVMMEEFPPAQLWAFLGLVFLVF